VGRRLGVLLTQAGVEQVEVAVSAHLDPPGSVRRDPPRGTARRGRARRRARGAASAPLGPGDGRLRRAPVPGVGQKTGRCPATTLTSGRQRSTQFGCSWVRVVLLRSARTPPTMGDRRADDRGR
jgi:hypothetical protein